MSTSKIIDSFRSLHDVSKAMNSTLDIDEVVEIIMEKTSALMGSARVLLMLLDSTGKVLSIHSSLGFEKDDLKLECFHNIKSFDHCIVHRGTVISLDDVLSGEDYRESIAVMPSLAQMVFAPLEIKGRAYGLLGVAGHGHELSEIELEIFCALGSQAAVAIENASLYRKLKDAFEHTAEALAEAVGSRDPYTGGHTRRVEEYALMVADAIGLQMKEREELKLAAILHDIGKIGIDDAILRKGGVLTGDEDSAMRRHPEIGARILGYVKEMQGVIPGVLHHHERFDGSGYPDGLKGERIPLNARIIAIADAFDALTTDRPYRKGPARARALAIISEDSAAQFDPALVRVFIDCVDKKGVGPDSGA